MKKERDVVIFAFSGFIPVNAKFIFLYLYPHPRSILKSYIFVWFEGFEMKNGGFEIFFVVYFY